MSDQSPEIQELARRFNFVIPALNRIVMHHGAPTQAQRPRSLFVLILLDHHALSQTRLSECTGIKPSALSKLIDWYVREGYIIRRCDEDDRRRQILSLAPKGKQTLDNAKRDAEETIGDLLAQSTPEEIIVLNRAAQILESKIRDHFEQNVGGCHA